MSFPVSKMVDIAVQTLYNKSEADKGLPARKENANGKNHI